MSAQSQDLTSAIATISNAINDSAARIDHDATLKEKRSSRQYRWDLMFRSITAILAVASPAIVAYSTTAGVADAYKLAAIVLSGLAGAAATLQAIFALQQSYLRNAIDALDLHEVKAHLESAKEAALQHPLEYERYADLKVALNDAMRRHKEITIAKQRAQLEKSLLN